MARRVTRKQIAALKYLIFHSKDAEPFAKQVCAYLLDQSDRLTRDVRVNFSALDGFISSEGGQAINGVHDMGSANGSTHLRAIMKAMGTTFHFSSHASPSEVWLAIGDYSPTARELRPTRAEIEAIDLDRPGLYPSLEKKRESVPAG